MQKEVQQSDIKILLTNQKETRRLLKNSISKEIADDLTGALNTLIKDNELNPDNLMYIVTNFMSIVGKYKTLTGIEKKEIVLILINQEIDKTQLEENTHAALKLMMETVVPNAIDMLVHVAKGRYKFKYLPKLNKFFKSCICGGVKN